MKPLGKQGAATACVASQFHTTHWSVVLAAGGDSSPSMKSALETLCRTYWYPLYAYVRRQGHDPQTAEDLTQSFFERFLEKNYLGQVNRAKGKFRSFLLASLNHFLADEWDRSRRQKRGGGCETVSFDAQEAEERYRLEPVDRLDPLRLYERRWAMTVLEAALRKLEAESSGEGGQRWSVLKGFLLGDKDGRTYAQAAHELGTSEAAVKMAVSRMRQRCRALLREGIEQTVSNPAEVEEEFQALQAALRS